MAFDQMHADALHELDAMRAERDDALAKVARLTDERDRLREDLDEAKRRADHWQKRVASLLSAARWHGVAEAERDALAARLERAEADRDAMRAVVEAAAAMVGALVGAQFLYSELVGAVIAAVDTYRAATPSTPEAE